MGGRVQVRVSPRSLLLAALVVLAASAFLFAVQLLSAAMRTLSPAVRPLLYGRAVGGRQLVGIGWLTAYVMLNGSVVAAIALSLFSAGLVGVSDLFLLVAGSRLGAAGIVLLVGGLEFLRPSEYSLPEAMRLGSLTFVVSHSMYVPATVVGVVVVGWAEPGIRRGPVEIGVRPDWVAFFEPLATATIRLLGAVPSVVVALLLFVGSLHLLDRLFESISTDWLRERVFVVLRPRWVSFLIGTVVTAVTTSVAFSVGVVVPVYNRGYIERREVVPYVMGASLGTLTDTLLVAVVLDSRAGVAVVVVLFATAALGAVVALVFYDAYFAAVDAVQQRLLDDERVFVAFLAALVVVPLALVVLPG